MASAEQDETKLCVLISGRGTNLQALIDACANGGLPHTRIARVISNRKAAYGLTRASAANIPTSYHNLVPYKKAHHDDVEKARAAYDADLADLILSDKPDLVVMAGFMHVVSPSFLEPLAAASVPAINLHPSLPGPSCIKGTDAILRAHEAFQRGEIQKTGCMIHYVIQEVDSGEVIAWREVDMREGEGLEDLEERVHAQEWEAIVEGTARAIERLKGR